MKMMLQELQNAIEVKKASKEELEILLENVTAALENKTKELEKVLKDQEKIISTKTEELRKALDLAQEANKAKTSFLATMSHEIRTPMNGVLGMISLLLDTPLNEEQQSFARIVESSAKTLLEIINDILDISKLEAGKVTLEIIPFMIKDLIESVRVLTQELAGKKKLVFKIEIDPEIPSTLLGDPTRLRQVVLNLVTNAIKFTEKGSITIQIKKHNEFDDRFGIYFEVIDTGIGISKKNQTKLFAQFSQVDSSITRKYGGSGLGLAICRNLVTLMNGEIGYESEEGKGSRFWFTSVFGKLDVAHKQKGNYVDEFDMQPQHLKILVAEDNEVNQLVIKTMLTKMGHDVTIAHNGLEAFNQVQNNVYDLVLMDMQMPVMDGLEATKQVRKLNGDVRRVPIIALTANAMQGDREKCLEAGMNGYLSKPINKEELIAILSQC
ncbi:MAG: ATP-binding protein [Alphaproteobacteria bacterium]|nr:ATP-binding protein [Alphaproteobacteria bacterium]